MILEDIVIKTSAVKAKVVLNYDHCKIYLGHEMVATLSFAYTIDGCFHLHKAYVDKRFRKQGLLEKMNKMAVDMFEQEQSEITLIAKICKENENKKYVEKVLKRLGFVRKDTKTHIYMIMEVGI